MNAYFTDAAAHSFKVGPTARIRNRTAGKDRLTRLNILALAAIIIVAAVVLGVPSYSVHSSSLSKADSDGNSSSTMLARRSPSLRLPGPLATFGANSSNSSIQPTNFAMLAAPVITTYDATCTVPKSTFALGETVCAQAVGAIGFRFAWVDSAGFVEQRTSITTDPQTDTFTLPTAQTSVINGTTVDNRGEWRVNVITSRGSANASAFFTVTDPQHKAADLSINKTLSSDGPVEGGPVQFSILIVNNGPDDTANVHFVDSQFTNATFNSVTQTGGLPFICTGTSSVDCTIAAFPKGSEATFLLNFTAGAAGTTITNTATVTSDTEELNPTDNSSSSAPTKIGSGTAPPACTLDCPDNINATADTTEGGQRGAHVTYAPPASSGTCGAITTEPASGSFFQVGTTTVTATSESGGGSCSFTVTVTDNGTNPPTISCPSDKTANANGDCEATVVLGTPTASGDNVTVVGSRSDGKPMYNCDANGNNCTRKSQDLPFSAGVTTVTWTATSHDDQGNDTGNASCQQTVTVNDTTPPVITAVDETVSADANCQAAVPDYSNSVTDNCSCAANDNSQDCVNQHRITTTQNPAAGTLLGPGSYTIHLTANDGSSNNDGAGNTTTKDITFTVRDTTPPTITCPQNMTVDTEPGTCSAHVITGTATATDNCDPHPTITGSRSDGKPLTDPYPGGTTTITWTATDSAGNHSSCDQTITVVDHEPPVIVLNGQTPSMWPPNHKYQTFGVSNFVTGVTDNCDTIGVGSVVITMVTSDEIENGNGDGNTFNDIVIAPDCRSVQLRAEREGNSNGRVYRIYFSVTDASGNVGTASSTVIVRHNPGEPVVDSGPHYTVTCGGL
jgi:hypothetical protein